MSLSEQKRCFAALGRGVGPQWTPYGRGWRETRRCLFMLFCIPGIQTPLSSYTASDPRGGYCPASPERWGCRYRVDLLSAAGARSTVLRSKRRPTSLTRKDNTASEPRGGYCTHLPLLFRRLWTPIEVTEPEFGITPSVCIGRGSIVQSLLYRPGSSTHKKVNPAKSSDTQKVLGIR
jgi:hypothetical protein